MKNAGGQSRIQRTQVPWRELPTLRVDEVAELIGIERKAVDKLIKNGDLEVRHVGRIPLVLTASLLEWLQGEKAAETPAAVLITAAHQAAAKKLAAKLR